MLRLPSSIVYPRIYLSTYLPTYLVFIHLSIYPSIHLSISIYPSIHPSTHPPVRPPTDRPTDLLLPIRRPLLTCRPPYPPTCLPAYLPTDLPTYQPSSTTVPTHKCLPCSIYMHVWTYIVDLSKEGEGKACCGSGGTRGSSLSECEASAVVSFASTQAK